MIQLAAHVLDRAKRGDAAELMEHAAKALALRLEGSPTKEELKFMKAAPGREQIAKQLGQAAEILQDWGERDRAEMVAKTARQFAPRRRERERERGRERERKRDVDRRERPQRRERRKTDTEQRMDKLADRVDRMTRDAGRTAGADPAAEAADPLITAALPPETRHR